MGEVIDMISLKAMASLRVHTPAPTRQPFHGMAWIPGGKFMMGCDHHEAEEAPARRVSVSGFWMDRYPVTNDAFRQFVGETGYVTVAERQPTATDGVNPTPQRMVPGSIVFVRRPTNITTRGTREWWIYVPGAHWRQPEGPGTNIKDKGHHPVVHIAYDDAKAYAAWAGKELPTEAEWEYAARGGLDRMRYAWGDEFMPRGMQMANTWPGDYTDRAVALGTTPAGSFLPNGYGLYDMTGNTWEWTQDWYQEHKHAPGSFLTSNNPRGGTREKSYDERLHPHLVARKVIKGGSYLCSSSQGGCCRPAARVAHPVDMTTCDLGFRCIVRTQDV